MSTKKIKKNPNKLTKTGTNVSQFEDRWSAVQTKLESVAGEQVQADIQLVNAVTALKLAQQLHSKAVVRKTLAEKRLSALRANLGAD
jgi:hypothetical protein